jgi:hypothetical protein
MKNIINKIKKQLNDDNRTKLIGILTILIFLWIILYFIPDLFFSLFNTLLGNLILLLSIILVVSYNIKYGLGLALIVIIIFRFSQIIKERREGFEWTSKSTQDFLLIQDTLNKNIVFDTNMIQNQASQEELDYYNKNGKWPWSELTQDLYKQSVNKNPFIRNYDNDSMNYAMTIYNEAAILKILSYQTKEGQMLLNGVLVNDTSGNPYEELPNGFGDFPYKSGLKEDKTKDIIKCNMDKENGATLERIKYTGKDGIYGAQTEKVTPVDYNDLENIIPGFKFLNGPCNPCGSINKDPDYSCPFRLELKDQSPYISSVWQSLWNVKDETFESTPTFLNEPIDPEKFPLLNQLQDELNKKNNL